ncbi:COX8A oxidase, partial [Podargus strigoides]|nr:COX8A oxidase [Podargus strigoides]
LPLTSRLPRSLLLSASRPGPARLRISSKPPKDPVGPVETVVGFTALFVTCLGPAAWVLAHLEDYKKRE